MAQERYERRGNPKSGTFGDVYKVWDTTLNVERAFKRVRVKDEVERAAVVHEAQLLVKLESDPNRIIVRLYDIIEGDTFVGLVMDWVEGQTLAEYLRDKGALSTSEALQITSKILKALEFAHSRNVLHSDIKPDNVMRDVDGNIRLVDFSVARILSTHSMGTVVGVTYPYAPPEFFLPPHKLDTRADLWATGVMLYKLVTGKQPFQVEPAQSNNPFAWGSAISSCQYSPLEDPRLQQFLNLLLCTLDKRLPSASAAHSQLPLAESETETKIPVPQINFQRSPNRTPMHGSNLYPPRTIAEYKAQMVEVKTEGRRKNLTIFEVMNLIKALIGRTPVTVGMWQEYCQSVKQMPKLPEYPVWKDGWDSVRDHPIVNVSWEECNAYANWAGLSLPDKFIWEYSASGGEECKYPWGNEWDSNKCRCSYKNGRDSGGTASVGSYPANGFGLYDMAGNVWEWCTDLYDRDKEQRMARGGSWFYDAESCFRCTSWYNSPPDGQEDEIGFRLCYLPHAMKNHVYRVDRPPK